MQGVGCRWEGADIAVLAAGGGGCEGHLGIYKTVRTIKLGTHKTVRISKLGTYKTVRTRV